MNASQSFLFLPNEEEKLKNGTRLFTVESSDPNKFNECRDKYYTSPSEALIDSFYHFSKFNYKNETIVRGKKRRLSDFIFPTKLLEHHIITDCYVNGETVSSYSTQEASYFIIHDASILRSDCIYYAISELVYTSVSHYIELIIDTKNRMIQLDLRPLKITREFNWTRDHGFTVEAIEEVTKSKLYELFQWFHKKGSSTHLSLFFLFELLERGEAVGYWFKPKNQIAEDIVAFFFITSGKKNTCYVHWSDILQTGTAEYLQKAIINCANIIISKIVKPIKKLIFITYPRFIVDKTVLIGNRSNSQSHDHYRTWSPNHHLISIGGTPLDPGSNITVYTPNLNAITRVVEMWSLMATAIIFNNIKAIKCIARADSTKLNKAFKGAATKFESPLRLAAALDKEEAFDTLILLGATLDEHVCVAVAWWSKRYADKLAAHDADSKAHVMKFYSANPFYLFKHCLYNADLFSSILDECKDIRFKFDGISKMFIDGIKHATSTEGVDELNSCLIAIVKRNYFPACTIQIYAAAAASSYCSEDTLQVFARLQTLDIKCVIKVLLNNECNHFTAIWMAKSLNDELLTGTTLGRKPNIVYELWRNKLVSTALVLLTSAIPAFKNSFVNNYKLFKSNESWRKYTIWAILNNAFLDGMENIVIFGTQEILGRYGLTSKQTSEMTQNETPTISGMDTKYRVMKMKDFYDISGVDVTTMLTKFYLPKVFDRRIYFAYELGWHLKKHKNRMQVMKKIFTELNIYSLEKPITRDMCLKYLAE